MVGSAPRCGWIVFIAGIALALATAAPFTPASADVSVSIYPHTICAEPQQLFTAYLWVDVAGSGFDGYETRIRFDPELLDFVSVRQESLMTDLCYNTWWRHNETDSTVWISHVALCGGDTLSGPGALSAITFRALSTTVTTAIAFEYIEFYRAGYDVPCTPHDGTVVIAAECLGACCVGGETCVLASSEECANLSGEFQGYATDCDPNPCDLAACCAMAECYITRQEECAQMSGTWHQEWEDCDGDPCAYQEVGDRPGARVPCLLAPGPNPFIHETLLRYELPAPGAVQIGIFDTGGRLVRTLLDGESRAHSGVVAWNGCDAAGQRLLPGAYFCRLAAAGGVRTARVVLLQ